MTALQLFPHATTPCDFIDTLQVQAHASGDSLRLTYIVHGDVQRLGVPESRPPARTDGLWRTTCFELFLRAADSAAYQEFNFSPSSQWAAYSFTGYREGMAALDLPEPPRIECVSAPQRLEVEVHLRSPLLARPGQRAALSAVLQTRDSAISYWALAHPQGKADFHDAAGFVAQALGVG